MKPYTLSDAIKEKYKSSNTFAKYYDKERLISSIAKIAIKLRKRKHFTQRQLANKIGTAQSVIARLESGQDTRIPSLGLLARIAAAADNKLTISFEKRN